MTTTKKWDRAAMQFTKCRYLPDRQILAVRYRNGDEFQIPVETLLGAGTAAADWGRVRIGETRDFLELPTSQGITEIAWDRVRCVADPAFRRHLVEQAAKSARRVGQRLRQVRLESGLTQGAIAKAAGVDRVTISRIENGRMHATYQTLVRIVAAMGRTIPDLAFDDLSVRPSGNAKIR